MNPRSKCLYGVLGSAVLGLAAVGGCGTALLDHLKVFADASGAFQLWWLIGNSALGVLGGAWFGMASFCVREG